MVNRYLTFVLASAALLLGACGKNDKSAESNKEPTAAQRAESREKAKDSPVFGTQVQALDKAKATTDAASKAAAAGADAAKKADQ